MQNALASANLMTIDDYRARLDALASDTTFATF